MLHFGSLLQKHFIMKFYEIKNVEHVEAFNGVLYDKWDSKRNLTIYTFILLKIAILDLYSNVTTNQEEHKNKNQQLPTREHINDNK